MGQLTQIEKHLINQTIKKCDSIILDEWLVKSKRWIKKWTKEAES